MARFAFLSDEWLVAARQLRAEQADAPTALPLSIRMNQVITDVPFGPGTIEAHLDTSGGGVELETGHLEKPDLTITVAYDIAKAILIDGDTQAALQAFLSGRVKVDGDITKLLALQALETPEGPGPGALAAYQRLRDITE